MKSWIGIVAALALAACAHSSEAENQDLFFARLSALCGQAFAGRVVTTDPRDEAFTTQPLVMHVRECSAKEIRIPFQVGEDRSRTWVITRTNRGVRLKHDHRHADGTEDPVSQYGGDTLDRGTSTRQQFPADDESKDLFLANDLAASVLNVWAIEVNEGVFVYELRRPNRLFRVSFDLKHPIPAPQPPWGARASD